MASHYEESMQRDIDRLRGKVAEMAALAEHALDAVLRAFLTRDRQLAYTVILRDRRIDELEKEIDRLCLEFLLRQQPVAKHLRFAYIAIKINQELERIGDYAESIARQVLKLSDLAGELPRALFEDLARRAIPMLRDAVRSFLEEDAALAQRTMAVEDEADALKSAINAELFRLGQEAKLPLKAITPLMTVARRFERVTDQAKNICEEVIYMVTGEFSKHLGGDVWRMIFIDGDNSGLSQMAEAIGNSLQQPEFVFASAGVAAGSVDPDMIAFLREKGIEHAPVKTRSVEQVPHFEYAQIIAPLTSAACRAMPKGARGVVLDWSEVADFSAAESPDEKRTALEAAYDFLHEHIRDLCKAVLADKIE